MTEIAIQDHELAAETGMVRTRFQSAAYMPRPGHRLGDRHCRGCLVLVEIAILSATVISRYLLNQPVTWSDELASLVFLWLGMLGATGALRRGEHMRLTIFMGRLSPSARSIVDLVAAGCIAFFWRFWCCRRFGWWIRTMPSSPADLELPAAYGVAAVATSVVLMLLVTLLRTAATVEFRTFCIVVVAISAAAFGLSSIKPLLAGLGMTNLLIFFLFGVALLIAIGVPIAFSFGFATILYFIFATRCPSP